MWCLWVSHYRHTLYYVTVCTNEIVWQQLRQKSDEYEKLEKIFDSERPSITVRFVL